ncbi:hypothetical protein CAEBREN_06579 [Caenorhabditis brenneri]|uniref:F-box associated domain-containing protein n=1 Tax=Caenorhabditis brenneri TaxID=135651 RepID=G0MFQ7_CAEBE|nr:hypothetical protein CAEBREN_06579 [Caenorhabditis brenneri]
MANSNRHLRIDNTKVPENYSHKNAFKFYVCSYWDARWVRIQDLFTLKNNDTVHLSWHELTYSDMNSYIKYWIDSDHDMVRIMKLYTEERIQPESLFDGIVVLKNPGIRGATYLVAANRTKQRKHQIMGVVWDDNRLRLYSWNKNEPIRFEENVYAESWAPEYEVLMVMNKKKELEGDLERIQNSLETNQDQNLVEKKNEISRELQNVSQKVAGYNLVFRDGVFSYE